MNYWPIILALLVIALCIGVPWWLGERAWRGEYEDKVEEIDEQAAMRDYRL